MPAKSFSIDMNNNFEPHYENNPDKKALISDLKKKSEDADEILIATDPDREGVRFPINLLLFVHQD